MTRIDIRDVITLSDSNKYVVCSKANYEGNDYLYLIDIVDNSNIKFGMEKIYSGKMNIVEIENQEIIRTLLPLFFNDAKDILKEIEEQ